jgi:signal transduction histidine kinase
MPSSLPPPPPAAPAPPPASPEARWWAWFLGTWLVLGALTTLQVALAMKYKGLELGLGILVGRGTALGAQAALFPLLLLLRRRLAAARVGRSASVALQGLLLLALLAVATPLEEAFAARFTPGVRFLGSVAAKVIGELVNGALAFAVATAVEVARQLREREHRALQLEGSLSEARLQALSAQLQPHFLFNTLGAISVLVHRDPPGADAMLTGLADLLRASLAPSGGRQEVPLREEVALLERYLSIMRVRHGARLSTRVSVPPELGDLAVPVLLLQPLVENALEHGVGRRPGPGQVALTAELQGGRLCLCVLDDGPGPRPGGGGEGQAGRGIGLTNTRLRLEQLYGAEARLTLAAEPGGGTRVVVELPARRAGEQGLPAAARDAVRAAS